MSKSGKTARSERGALGFRFAGDSGKAKLGGGGEENRSKSLYREKEEKSAGSHGSE